MTFHSSAFGRQTRNVFCMTAIALSLAACGGSNTPATQVAPTVVQAAPLANQLYAQTNETANSIVHLVRAADGSISIKNRAASGGTGLGGVKPGASAAVPNSLVSQNSVVISTDKTQLFAVNAGDASVSVFSIDQASGDLTLKKVTKTLGATPTSLAYRNGFLYVMFQSGANQVGAYAVQADGALAQLGLYALPLAATPTQLVVSPDANFIVVSDGTSSNAVVSYPMNANGTLGSPIANTASINTPFAGAFSSPTVYLSSDIAGKALASYTFSNAGALSLIGSVPSGEGAPCWLVVTPSGKYAYVGNGAGTISSYAVAANGTLSLLNAKAAIEAGVLPGVNSVSGDSWVSADGKFLYADYLGDDKIVAYSIGADGSIAKINEQVIGTATKLSLQGLVGI
ncbi:MAG: beta-propeller fold lactonase family protein [Pseudomonadota bacterium]